MSIAICVEIENRLAWQEMKDILLGMGLFVTQEDEGEVRGGLPASNMYVVAEVVADPDRMHPLTEGTDFAKDWVIGIRARFYYVMSRYDECSSEMNEFVSRLADVSPAYFIVAFENEKVYAIRDQAGLTVLSNF
ncbi:hypothetical protein [Ralstonia solanacearum]|uniref:hypothetical protein n=2 Tax=Ralstonia solanacearum TaxID=305 RepID=UPI000F60CCBD|nr:hypothetical protein [Ralstonia solanacearum]MCL9843474.1 hypothetical protein [Ralstonia solanacearum]MDC6259968.1 hypothetical protein [Ralstonia solanacearum]MDC6304957.1 hypothetical protein [Ralstonia solanacearum]